MGTCCCKPEVQQKSFGESPKPLEEAPSTELLSCSALRGSVRYQSREIGLSERSSKSERRSFAPFDRDKLGTHTRHGIAPGPRGVKAKINQDRGVICWPFAGSTNQAMLCVFDGHGPKGEVISEYCMTNVLELLEQDNEALAKDPAACLEANMVKTDEMLLSSPELGRTAMNSGTTATVCYLCGNSCWVACSGDSRAVKGSYVNGVVQATDMSNDHKPDLPAEMLRICKAGGTVSASGPNGQPPPSRVWAQGRVGLAMSRSLGDGECKRVGVIPDPEVLHFDLAPAKGANGAGAPDTHDAFLIIASDGVWEFIPSLEACQIVHKFNCATDACAELVQQAAARWKRFEGSYRDDITAIVAYLPFLDEGVEGNPVAAGAGELDAASASLENEDMHIWLNKGKAGLTKLTEEEESPGPRRNQNGGEYEDDEDDFVKRRLSMSSLDDFSFGETKEEHEEHV